MKKLVIAVALLLGVATVGEVVAMAPASADNVCHVASPQINNSVVCARVALDINLGGYPYYISNNIQVKAVGYTAVLQVRNGSNGVWYTCSAAVSYSPLGSGVYSGWCGSTWRPSRARLVVTNVYTGAVTTYSWNPFPPV